MEFNIIWKDIVEILCYKDIGQELLVLLLVVSFFLACLVVTFCLLSFLMIVVLWG